MRTPSDNPRTRAHDQLPGRRRRRTGQPRRRHRDVHGGQRRAGQHRCRLSYDVEANTDAALGGLAITDVDANAGTFTTTLSVAHGTLDGHGRRRRDGRRQRQRQRDALGTLAQINALLAAGSVVYRGAQDFFGDDTLTLATDDGGSTGSGGALIDSDQVDDPRQHLAAPARRATTASRRCPATNASTRSAATTPSRSTSAWSTRPSPGAATRSSSTGRRATRC